MKEGIAKEWIKRLRSGAYKQTRGILRSTDSKHDGEAYCCLGVLCEIACEQGIVTRIDSEYGRAIYKDTSGVDYFGILPGDVVRWAGMNSDTGYAPNIHTGSLTELNDKEGYTFEQIAGVVEKNMEAL